MSVGDTLIGDNAQRHNFSFFNSLSVDFHLPLRLPHCYKNARSAEFIKMMVDGVGSDGSQICNEKAGVERTGMDN